MPVVAAALSGLAGVSFALLLLGVAGAAFSVWSLSRLRRDHLVVEAAETLATVNLSHVVRRYVPRRLRSHRRSEELLLARQIIDARLPRWKRWAIVSAVLMVCSAGAAAFFVHRNLHAASVVQVAAKALPSGDALAAIRGVWGWRSDFLRSCTENPQVISVSPDRATLSVHYAKPISPAATAPIFDYDVVSTQPDVLVLKGPMSTARPPSVTIKFLDADTYIATSSSQPFQTTGAIERCR
ncbi:MAG TPA: hypothetical protein VGI78_14225 [Acetobacteraceae bacterium]